MRSSTRLWPTSLLGIERTTGYFSESDAHSPERSSVQGWKRLRSELRSPCRPMSYFFGSDPRSVYVGAAGRDGGGGGGGVFGEPLTSLRIAPSSVSGS